MIFGNMRSVFFLQNNNRESFDHDFVAFLKELFTEFIHKPTVNAIKDDIYATCISIIDNNTLRYKIQWNEE